MPLLDIMQAFESFSEDPFLAGHLAAGYVNGLQQEGVGGVLKHLVCNDMEHERFSASVTVEDRRKSSLADGIVSITRLDFLLFVFTAFREVYLLPFMIALKEAKPWAVMTAYGRINGVHCSEDKKLLQDILRNEWGFEGLYVRLTRAKYKHYS